LDNFAEGRLWNDLIISSGHGNNFSMKAVCASASLIIRTIPEMVG
jgi:hypothetical protein